MTETFKFDKYAGGIIQNLDELRSENVFCDGVLQSSDSRDFPVHRCVLAAASPYFRAMFSGGFQEMNTGPDTPIVLSDISSVGLKCVLDCLYSGKLSLTEEVVYEIFITAHMIQMPEILKACEYFLTKNVTADMCFKNLELAEKYELSNLERATTEFILKNFTQISVTKAFKDLPIDVLTKYLSDERLAGEEINIFKAAKRWVEYKPERRQHLSKVMSLINFKAIPTTTLADTVAEDEMMQSNKQCREMILHAWKYHTHVYSQPFSAPFTARGENTVVLLKSGSIDQGTGTLTHTTIMPVVMCNFTLDIKKDVLKSSKNILKFKLSAHSINLVRVKNFLYIFATSNETFAAIAKRYDGNTNVWIELAPPPRMGTVGSTASYVDGTAIVVGGMLINQESTIDQLKGCSIIDNTLGYSIVSNEWNTLSNCSVKSVYHSACVREDVVYIAGGYNYIQRPGMPNATVQLSRKMHAYHLKGDIWLKKADLNHARSEFVFEAVHDKLFAMGGGDYCQTRIGVHTVEMYDILNNQWTFVADTMFPYDSAASFVDGQDIIILGGFKDEVSEESKEIHVFDSRCKIKTLKSKMPFRLCRHVCAVLKM